MAADQQILQRYLDQVARVVLLEGSVRANPFAQPSKEEGLAFWINAYNACVVQEVLEHYPLKSVKDVKGFFEAIRYQVAGASLTLNEIEAKGRAFGDWRIHVALVCASASCPPLRGEAYVPERLNEQLERQATTFLSDPAHGLRVEDQTLLVSKIFQWYASDITPTAKRLTPEVLLDVILPYVPRTVVHGSIHHRTLTTLKFLDYDWSLNGADTR